MAKDRSELKSQLAEIESDQVYILTLEISSSNIIMFLCIVLILLNIYFDIPSFIISEDIFMNLHCCIFSSSLVKKNL